jgi:hypothetical protein
VSTTLTPPTYYVVRPTRLYRMMACAPAAGARSTENARAVEAVTGGQRSRSESELRELGQYVRAGPRREHRRARPLVA